jgi:hypothetical protein
MAMLAKHTVYFKTFKLVNVISFVEHSVARKTVHDRRKSNHTYGHV